MSEVDLNLLRVFDTLFEQRSVTRTATRLGLTQSAISHALGRLRQILGDPLFVRRRGGLQPTARALEIAPGVREGLVQLRSALSPSLFDPATAHRQFSISAGSYFCALLLPDVIARARTSAPGVSFRTLTPGPDLLASLDEGMVDIALGSFGKVPARLVMEPLHREELVWIASTKNPGTGGAVDLADLATRPRLHISGGGPLYNGGAFASEGGLERRVIASAGDPDENGRERREEVRTAVYDVITAMAVVGRSDLVALVPRGFAVRNAERDGLVIIEPQGAGNGIDMAMLWHSKQGEDVGLAWLRDLIRASSDVLDQ